VSAGCAVASLVRQTYGGWALSHNRVGSLPEWSTKEIHCPIIIRVWRERCVVQRADQRKPDDAAVTLASRVVPWPNPLLICVARSAERSSNHVPAVIPRDFLEQQCVSPAIRAVLNILLHCLRPQALRTGMEFARRRYIRSDDLTAST